MTRRLAVAAALALAGCTPDYQPKVEGAEAAAAAPSGRTATALFAGGCFWCTEADFEKVPGVLAAVSGYTGGGTPNPTYQQVSAGGTGHYEAVRVSYDPGRVSYSQLVDYYFRTVDPTDAGGQFCDRGESYRTAIFVADEGERAIALAEKAEAAAALSQDVVTPILPAGRFYEAEAYHQDYYKKNKLKYGFYRSRCGRDDRLHSLWGNL
ncbi:MAG TPA: peptide-methionine (S)-S-oxide reductase MsrA [Allosphingosinicella sp.]|nr:peptide-methionine (S)-S-oxide reductase MsrA [Allosphingosinicella sp.]